MYQLLLLNLVWPYVGPVWVHNVGPSRQALVTHSFGTDHSEKALSEQNPGEGSCGDESSSSAAAIVQWQPH